LPPLDVDVAARLAEEGGEPLTEPMFGETTSIAGVAGASDDGATDDGATD
jgi:hypothetical protein